MAVIATRLVNGCPVFVFLASPAATAIGFLYLLFAPVIGGFRIAPHADSRVAGNQGSNGSQEEKKLHGSDHSYENKLSKLDFQADRRHRALVPVAAP